MSKLKSAASKSLEEILKMQYPEPIMSNDPSIALPKALKPSEIVFGATPVMAPVPAAPIAPPQAPDNDPTGDKLAAELGIKPDQPPVPAPAPVEPEKSSLSSLFENKDFGLALQSLGRVAPLAFSGKDQSANIGQAAAAPYIENAAREQAQKALEVQQREQASQETYRKGQVANEAAKLNQDKLKLLDEASRAGIKLTEEQNKELRKDTTPEEGKLLGHAEKQALSLKAMKALTANPEDKAKIEKDLKDIKGAIFIHDIEPSTGILTVFKNRAIVDTIKDQKTREYVDNAFEYAMSELRKESGAAISAPEYNAKFKTVLPTQSRSLDRSLESMNTGLASSFDSLPIPLKLGFIQRQPDVISKPQLDQILTRYESNPAAVKLINMALESAKSNAQPAPAPATPKPVFNPDTLKSLYK